MVVMPKHSDTGFGAKQAKQPVSGLATLSRCFCAYAKEQGRELVPTGSFVPIEVMLPLRDEFQKVGIVSSHVP